MSEVFLPTIMEEVERDILAFDFFSEAYCDFLLAACDGVGIWKPNPQDEYYTQDLDFEEHLPSIYELVETQLIEKVGPFLSKYWRCDEFKIDALFAVKYTMEGQQSLSLHHDDSYISGSIKLNNLYDGAVLKFPRQKWDNRDVSVGKLICWPGKLTHPHECSPLKAGNKYSLTIWTKEVE